MEDKNNPLKEINQRVDGTDIFVFNYNPETKLYTYSRPFNVDEVNDLARESNQVIASQYSNTNQLVWGNGLEAYKHTGELINMSTLKAIVANRVLMKRTNGKQWLPTIKEGIELRRHNMLPPEVMIDFGLVLYDGLYPDKEIAQSLIATVKAQNYAMPVVASFKSLDLKIGGVIYSVMPQIVSADGLYHGNEAESLLTNHFPKRANYGVHKVCLDTDGRWDASRAGVLDKFDLFCSAGRISTKDSMQTLEQEAKIFNHIRRSLDSISHLTQ